MLFSQELWQRNLNLYQKILDLPFNQELANGTLDKEAFCHYVIQDAQYLVAYGRVLAVAAAKALMLTILCSFLMQRKSQLWSSAVCMTTL